MGARPAGAQVRHARSVLNSLRRTVRAFRAAAQAAEAGLGISGAQHFVLERLADAPALSLNDLATRTLTHKSSVSVVVSRLVERGLVRRHRSAADGRSIVLTLTPAGRRALARAPESAQHRMVTALRRFPPGQLARFARLFERFTAELGVATLEPLMLFEEERAERSGGRLRRAGRDRNAARHSGRGRGTRRTKSTHERRS
ncbi:MAG TPA: MarR family transcriptional regulator [Gemmatimonadales bacterium]|nr:MarR family transcriptional regulator [Gemmatimonadales bacterium]